MQAAHAPAVVDLLLTNSESHNSDPSFHSLRHNRHGTMTTYPVLSAADQKRWLHVGPLPVRTETAIINITNISMESVHDAAMQALRSPSSRLSVYPNFLKRSHRVSATLFVGLQFSISDY